MGFKFNFIGLLRPTKTSLLPFHITENPNLHLSGHKATTIPAPTPRPDVHKSSTHTLTDCDGLTDISLLDSHGPTDDKERLRSLELEARILFVVSIILTALTCGGAIPALLAIYAARRRLRRCALVSTLLYYHDYSIIAIYMYSIVYFYLGLKPKLNYVIIIEN